MSKPTEKLFIAGAEAEATHIALSLNPKAGALLNFKVKKGGKEWDYLLNKVITKDKGTFHVRLIKGAVFYDLQSAVIITQEDSPAADQLWQIGSEDWSITL